MPIEKYDKNKTGFESNRTAEQDQEWRSDIEVVRGDKANVNHPA